MSLPWQRESVKEKCNSQHSIAHFWKPTYKRKNLAKISYTSKDIAHFVPNLVAMGTGLNQKNMRFQHSLAHLRKPLIGAKIFYASRVIANLVPNFVATQRRSIEKNATGSIRWRIPENTFINAKNSRKIFYASRVIADFVPNFVAMATGVGRGKMQLAAFDGPFPKNPPIGAKISYTSQVIANFVPNFVAMATREGPG